MGRGFLIVLLITAILSASVFAKAAIQKPSLTFNGNTAYCGAMVKEYGKSITVTLSLWQGGTMLASWSASGQNIVEIQRCCTAPTGLTYTLKLNGTINVVAFSEVKVIRTNYEMNK